MDEGNRPPRGDETVLVVDDDEMVTKFACATLELQGYRVICAPDGEQALRVAEERVGPIDLLLLDVVLPGIQGPELANALTSRLPGVGVLFMSGYTDLSARGISKDSPWELLPKPFTVGGLSRAVRQALHSPGPSPPAG